MNEETAFNHGSVVSLKLTDFMQFRYVEFHPGPSLNVIIGPNGSGKSSIVNGKTRILNSLEPRNPWKSRTSIQLHLTSLQE